jgi:hypothetical protein
LTDAINGGFKDAVKYNGTKKITEDFRKPATRGRQGASVDFKKLG